MVFEVGANGLTETQTINNLKLEGVTRFVGGQTSRGSIRTNDMQWTATIWLHRPRAAYFYHVNPIKPAGWQQYTIDGDGSYVYEYYTHDVKIVKENNVPVQGSQIILRHKADAETSFINSDLRYSLTTDVNGEIPQQEINTYHNLVTFADFDLRVVSYTQQIGGGVRDLQNGQIEETIVTQKDPSLPETDKSVVDAYTVISNANELYDAIKAYQVDNYTGEETSLVIRDGGSIDLGIHDIRVNQNQTAGLIVETLPSGSLNFKIKGPNYIGDLKTTGVIDGDSQNWIGRREDQNGIIEREKVLTFTGLIQGSEVRVYTNDLSQEIGGIEESGTSFSVVVQDNSATYVIHHIDYEYIRLEGVDTSSDTTIPIKQRIDRGYRND